MQSTCTEPSRSSSVTIEYGLPLFFETPFCTAAISPPMRVRLRFGNSASLAVLASAYFSRIGANGVSGWPVT